MDMGANTGGNKDRNILTTDVQVKGEIAFAGDLYFDGKLEGGVRSEGNLLLGENGSIQGDVQIGNMIVRGRFNGNILCAGRIDLKSRAEMFGDITAARVVMEEGVTYLGRVDVDPSRAVERAASGNTASVRPLPVNRVDQPRPEVVVLAEPVRINGRPTAVMAGR
jgi:cytoskeletal protein CcmA (bactofilin family)